jgi:hypothetical protein
MPISVTIDNLFRKIKYNKKAEHLLENVEQVAQNNENIYSEKGLFFPRTQVSRVLKSMRNLPFGFPKN